LYTFWDLSGLDYLTSGNKCWPRKEELIYNIINSYIPSPHFKDRISRATIVLIPVYSTTTKQEICQMHKNSGGWDSSKFCIL
jgi:hypothetical protein